MSNFMVLGGKSKFPIIISPEIDKEKFLFYIEKQLIYESATHVARQEDHVTFSGNFSMLIRLRTFLNLGEEGVIRVTTDRNFLVVIYRQTFIKNLFILIVGGLVLTIFANYSPGFDLNLLIAIMSVLIVIQGIDIFARLASLAMFIERIYDAFMKN